MRPRGGSGQARSARTDGPGARFGRGEEATSRGDLTLAGILFLTERSAVAFVSGVRSEKNLGSGARELRALYAEARGGGRAAPPPRVGPTPFVRPPSAL